MILNHSSVVCLDSCSCERKRDFIFSPWLFRFRIPAFSSPSDVAHIVFWPSLILETLQMFFCYLSIASLLGELRKVLF